MVRLLPVRLTFKTTANLRKSGTGGVSMFALLICLAAGIQPIITSSSDTKLSTAQALGESGVVQTINYKTHSNWEEKARELTGGRGVDVVVDNIGPTAIVQNLSSLARRGVVSLVGFLGGFKVDEQPEILGQVLMKSGVIRFVYLPLFYSLFEAGNAC
jgi:NADPH:quinone reductase-like Zn-dependent oxidoreductase